MTTLRPALGLLAALAGCAHSPQIWNGLDVSSGQAIVLRPAESFAMPPLDGSYRSPQLGLLLLSQIGPHVQGRFEYERGHARVTGRLEGEVDGNLVRFAWHETHHMSAENELKVHGNGFLLFDPPQGDETRPRLFGRRDYEVMTENQPHGEHTVAVRDGGPIYAVKLAPDELAASSRSRGSPIEARRSKR